MTPRRPRNRNGLAIAPALVCLVLVTLICAGMIKLARTQRGLIRDEERRMQAEWLAESGAARASARLAASETYKGETWDIASKALGGRGDARVTIVVEPVEKSPGRRRVRVEADYPRADPYRARQTKHLIVDLRPETPRGPS